MGPLLLDIDVSRGVWMALVAVVWLFGGNGLIHLFLRRTHARVRQDLTGDRLLFDRPVRARVSSRALFGGSVNWVKGNLLVTEEASVFFQRNLVIAQPPIQLLRQPEDTRRSSRSMVGHVVVQGRPTLEDGKVVIEGKRGIARMTLTITSDEPEQLLECLVAFLDRQEPPDAGQASYRRNSSRPTEVNA